jgi:hypothetical protein
VTSLGSGDVLRDVVGRVPLQAVPVAVVVHRGLRVRMAGERLHVTHRDAGVETGNEQCSNRAE